MTWGFAATACASSPKPQGLEPEHLDNDKLDCYCYAIARFRVGNLQKTEAIAWVIPQLFQCRNVGT